MEIESGVEIPPRGRGRPAKYPFAKMKIGDSFSYRREDRHKVGNAASTYQARHGIRFVMRTGEVMGRIWRVENDFYEGEEDMMCEIEKGIPIPPGRPAYKEFPFDQMEVGDSILIPANDAVERRKAQHNVKRAGEVYGFKFRCQSNSAGVRVWRIE